MTFGARTNRQLDYDHFPSTCPIVIDNGACNFRIGWGGESDPRVVFRNIIQRPRHKATGESVVLVGAPDSPAMKYFDCTRSQPRSAFDSNVVFQFETMEYILDYGFERLGANGSQIDHPVLMTECLCNPLQSRSKMAELLFETYGVPSLAFGVDAVFSYKHNQSLGNCNENGIVICPGFAASHVIPFIRGEPVYGASCRTDVGGHHVSHYLKQLLSLKYPHHAASITWEKVEDLKADHCYVAADYASESRLFRDGGSDSEERTRTWRLPWLPPPPERDPPPPPSPSEVARKACLREKQGQRLREMAEAKRASRIDELGNELRGLEFLLGQLDHVDGPDVRSFLSETGYVSRHEIESSAAKLVQLLRKARGDRAADVVETFPLVDVPDDVLTADEIKEKKRQAFLKMTSEGRRRAKQRRLGEELERERRAREDETRRLEDPDTYLDQMRSRYRELSERAEETRKRSAAASNGGGNRGRGERLNAAQKERMRLLTTAAFDRGKDEDTFGATDDDWQLYKLMARDDDDDDGDGDAAELRRVSARLAEIDPGFVAVDPGFVVEVPPRRLTEEDFVVLLGVERFRCPEVLFCPSLVGVEQSGLDEMVGSAIRRLGFCDVDAELTHSVLLTGGACLTSGLVERVEAGIRMIRSCGSLIRVVHAADPLLDAWRGASESSTSPRFLDQAITREDYSERGDDLLRAYRFNYTDTL